VRICSLRMAFCVFLAGIGGLCHGCVDPNASPGPGADYQSSRIAQIEDGRATPTGAITADEARQWSPYAAYGFDLDGVERVVFAGASDSDLELVVVRERQPLVHIVFRMADESIAYRLPTGEQMRLSAAGGQERLTIDLPDSDVQAVFELRDGKWTAVEVLHGVAATGNWRDRAQISRPDCERLVSFLANSVSAACSLLTLSRERIQLMCSGAQAALDGLSQLPGVDPTIIAVIQQSVGRFCTTLTTFPDGVFRFPGWPSLLCSVISQADAWWTIFSPGQNLAATVCANFPETCGEFAGMNERGECECLPTFQKRSDGSCGCPAGTTFDELTVRCGCANGLVAIADLADSPMSTCVPCEEAVRLHAGLATAYRAAMQTVQEDSEAVNQCVRACGRTFGAFNPLLCLSRENGPCAHEFQTLETNLRHLESVANDILELELSMTGAGCAYAPVGIVPNVE
jgi:hypothetical protein